MVYIIISQLLEIVLLLLRFCKDLMTFSDVRQL